MAPGRAWRLVILCWCRADTGRLEVPKGLPVPTACGALRASRSFATACSCAAEVFSEGQGRPGWGQGPCAASSSSPECQEVAAFMGVQSEFFRGPGHVPGLALAVGVGRNTTDCGLAQGTSGRAWSKKGCHPPHFTTPCCLPPLDSHPSHLLHPVPWSHPPSRLRKLPGCPFYPLHTQHASPAPAWRLQAAMSTVSRLLSLDCCAPQNKVPCGSSWSRLCRHRPCSPPRIAAPHPLSEPPLPLFPRWLPHRVVSDLSQGQVLVFLASHIPILQKRKLRLREARQGHHRDWKCWDSYPDPQTPSTSPLLAPPRILLQMPPHQCSPEALGASQSSP
ncbi:unnamed protein product [Rangifer tarandus platyrhynchus]|uniref:Uncharacterized protein n=2 Tax=Rangifer tarandus platyrhynchus TaxID=3082113 RepID=A0ABN8ZA46_RANTA|nr:unnamed protein product [Rangifer tarandus platyrhynchus]